MPSATTITLHIVLPKGGREELLLVAQDESVRVLKQLVMARTGLAPDEQTLYFKGMLLDDDAVLSFYDIADGYTLRLGRTRGRSHLVPTLHARKATTPVALRGLKSWRAVVRSVQWIVCLWRASARRRGTDRTLPMRLPIEHGFAYDVSPTSQASLTAAAHQALLSAPNVRDANDASALTQWLLSLSKCTSYLIAECIASHGMNERWLSQLHPSIDVTPSMELRACAAGDCVFKQGDVGDCMYIVLHGSITMAMHGFGCIGHFGPGTVFGDGATPGVAVDGQMHRTATALIDYDAIVTHLVVLRPAPAVAVLRHQLHNMLRVKLNYLHNISYFRDFSRASMVRLAYSCTYTAFTAKTLLVAQGDRITALFLLVAGTLTTMTHLPNAATKVLDMLEAPQLCGEEHCAGKTRSSVTVLAMPGAVVLAVPLPLVDMMAVYHPSAVREEKIRSLIP
ncbi:hypothetical protein SPRG_09370 [Saprolegnia parasitica CBS 223.65]|uniref:Ubiquitin-like domain-containing protein n=1 Tax=Saprolegnia parasitica (strain CBS 223.65) TaxID=695850 RepID=A0A067C4H3_SAPPC|nr:hypothetical protein SPRG_09370 [Saprolegnia parasitica CBS 223.65]KDO25428.1 hypothetical protein SPRG_09370 [Saprolegnia parasitica CBS 223.65]|eukprot:XP_012203855.1 hypothetical protein SPRG_09370 [Saprolegnia parasitica CBS 223.65]